MVLLHKPNKMEDNDIILEFINMEMIQEVPTYNFYIFSKKEKQRAGEISLRTKTTYEEEYLWGNMGFIVYEEFQGRRYALKASKLLITFARKCGMNQIFMTVDPTNVPSIKTITNLGGYYLETIDVPKDSSLYEAEKCDYSCRFCLYI